VQQSTAEESREEQKNSTLVVVYRTIQQGTVQSKGKDSTAEYSTV
jgi:hypothetical protein